MKIRLVFSIISLAFIISCFDDDGPIIVKSPETINSISGGDNNGGNIDTGGGSGNGSGGGVDNGGGSGNGSGGGIDTGGGGSNNLDGAVIGGTTHNNDIYIITSSCSSSISSVFFGCTVASSSIYKSSDYGNNWSLLVSVDSVISDIVVYNDQNIFFSTDSSRIYKTSNGGVTFSYIEINEYWHRNSSITGLLLNSTDLYAIRTRSSKIDLIYSGICCYFNSGGYLKDYIPADTRFDYTTELIRLDFNLNILRSNSSALGDSSFFIDEFDGYILMADKRGIGKFSLTSLEQLSYFEYRTSNNDQYVLSIDRNFPDNLLVATGYGGVWLSSDYGNSFTKKSIDTPYIFDSAMDDQATLFVSGKNESSEHVVSYSNYPYNTFTEIINDSEGHITYIDIIGDKLIVAGDRLFKYYTIN